MHRGRRLVDPDRTAVAAGAATRASAGAGQTSPAGHPACPAPRHHPATAGAGDGVRLRASLPAQAGAVTAGRCLRPAGRPVSSTSRTGSCSPNPTTRSSPSPAASSAGGGSRSTDPDRVASSRAPWHAHERARRVTIAAARSILPADVIPPTRVRPRQIPDDPSPKSASSQHQYRQSPRTTTTNRHVRQLATPAPTCQDSGQRLVR